MVQFTRPCLFLAVGVFLTVPKPSPGRELYRLDGHETGVYWVVFSPDGAGLVTVDASGEGRYWETTTGELRERFNPLARRITSVSFSPDSKHLAWTGADGDLVVHRLRGTPSGYRLKAHRPYPTALAFSRDGKLLATGGAEGGICLREPSTGKELRQLAGHGRAVSSLSFSPCGRYLVSGGGDHFIRFWDIASGKDLFGLHEEGMTGGAVFSPDGRSIAALSNSYRGLRLWEVASRRERLRIPLELGARALAFSPDGQTLVVASWSNIIYLCDVPTGKVLRQLEGHKKRVTAVAYSPHGLTVASASEDKTARIWDVRELRGRQFGAKELSPQKLRALWADLGGRSAVKAHRAIWALAAAPEQALPFLKDRMEQKGLQPLPKLKLQPVERLLADLDKKYDDVAAREQILRQLEQHGRAAERALHRVLTETPLDHPFAAKTLATVGRDGTLRLWDVATVKEKRKLALGTSMHILALSPDGSLLAGIDPREGEVRMYALSTGKELFRVRVHRRMATCVAFAPDGKTLASGGEEGTVCLWNTATGKRDRQLTGHHDARADNPRLQSLAFSPDGRLLASSSWDRTIRLWEVATGKQLRVLQGRHQGSMIAFSPDGRILASAHPVPPIHLWDVATGQLRLRIPNPAWGGPAFAPDGRTLATGGFGKDHDLHIWDAATGQHLLQRRRDKDMWLGALGYSPDGRTLNSYDYFDGVGVVGVWNLKGLKIPSPTALKSEALPALWDDLGDDADTAHKAVWTLAAAPELAVPFLEGKLRHQPSATEKTVARLLAQLDDRRFAVREKAARELEKLDEAAVPSLRQALRGTLSAEARKHIERLLQRLAPSDRLVADELRVVRAVEALEHANSPAARRVLRQFAKGVSTATLTREAEGTLERLKRRPASP